LEYFLIAAVVIVFLFTITHLRPLDENEIRDLSSKRRTKTISGYFTFDRREYNVDKNFKKRMHANGKFYALNENLYNFPSTAAGLLKYKKHEWIIIAFENNRKILSCWLNKGFNRSCVTPYLSVDDMINISQQGAHSTVMIFHNHPNSNPNHFDCSKPSQQDIKSANEFASKLNSSGINLLEFVCERGNHHQYFSKFSDSFLPISEFIEVVRKQNGKSKFGNFILHLARIF
jgi:hypothetical protein